MSAIFARISAEPVAFYAVVQAALTLAVTFGLRLTPEQTGAVLVFTGAVLAFLTRQRVTPA